MFIKLTLIYVQTISGRILKKHNSKLFLVCQGQWCQKKLTSHCVPICTIWTLQISVLSSRTPRPDPFLTSDRLESGLLCVRRSRFLLFILPYANQTKSSFSRARTANKKCVWNEKLSIGFSPLKKKNLEVSLSPLARIFDTIYTEKGIVPIFSLWLSFTFRWL